MKLHRTETEFNCGIDLHTTSMYVCVLNRQGETLVHKKVANNDLDYLEKVLSPYRHDLTVACESTPNWYVLSDFCDAVGVRFVLGHALYMTAISKSKTKNDKVDSKAIADMLRTNNLPESYVCPKDYRAPRDLMRRRRHLVEKRTDLKNSLAMSIHMHGFTPLQTSEKIPSRRRDNYLERAESDPLLSKCYDAYLNVIEELDKGVLAFEKAVEEYACEHHPEAAEALRSGPGFGRIAAQTVLYESGDVTRFTNARHYCSYARVACNEGSSNGKSCGSRGRKQGNGNLKWIFDQIAVHAGTHDETIRKYRDWLRGRHGDKKARNVLAHRFARFAFYALRDGRAFDLKAFLPGKEGLLKRKKK